MFPKVPDQHKVGRPLIPNGLGVFYVLFTTVYLFLVYFLQQSSIEPVSAAFTLAACILFGGFMGMMDDWIDLKMALQSLHATDRSVTSNLLCTSVWRKNQHLTSVLRNNRFRCSLLLHHNPLNRYDCHKHRKPARRLKRVRISLPRHSHRGFNGFLAELDSHDWATAILASTRRPKRVW